MAKNHGTTDGSAFFKSGTSWLDYLLADLGLMQDIAQVAGELQDMISQLRD